MFLDDVPLETTVHSDFQNESLNSSEGSDNEQATHESDCEAESQYIQFTPGPLGNKFMDISTTLNIFTGPYTILPEIPTGRKDGMYFVVDNAKNNERRNGGQKSEFWDDRGSWTNGASPTYTFIERGTKQMSVHKRDGVYCMERMVDKKKVYEPIEPQPSVNELLVVKRLYNNLTASEKGPNQFKRRCTWILNSPNSMPQIPLNVAVIEYIGIFPDRKPHGLVKTSNAPMYIRTKPEVHRELKEKLKYQSVKTVEKFMNQKTMDDNSKQRNEKQLRNIKYSHTKSTDVTANVADQLIAVEEMTKTHEFVYSVKHLKGLTHPVITLCSSQQVIDIKRFCGTGRTVLGVDKTYNLGDFHVTPTVYKDLSVRKLSTGQHPISLGPTFIHTNSSAKTYSSFFHDLADNLTDEEIKNMTLGSDEEKAFKVAISRCLPGSTHTLCTRHLRENTNRYMEDLVGYPKYERQVITEGVYGRNGLTSAIDVDTYQFRLTQIKETINDFDSKVGEKKFLPYFTEHLIPKLWSGVIEPCRKGKIETGWTNNNCESANHILKNATGWKCTDIPKLIELFTDIVRNESIERARAIRGRGNYELDNMFVHHCVDIDKWASMTQEVRDKREKKFREDRGKLNQNTIVSKNGLRTILRTPTAGKKPNQRKRKRAERSRTTSAKRILLE